MEAQVTANAPLDVLRKGRDRSRWVPLYAGGISALGTVIILIALVYFPEDRLGLILFAILAAAAELGSIELFVNSRSRVSASSMFATAGILVFGPLAGALIDMTSGIMTVVTTTILQHQLPRHGRASWLQRSAFNVGMLVTAQAVAGCAYVLAGGAIGSVARVSNMVPLMAAVSAGALANQLILIGVITLQTGQRPLSIWRRDFQWATPIAILGSILGGGALALAYEMFGLLGLVVFCLPILATGYSFRLYVNHTKVYVNKLEEMNDSLDEVNLGLLETLGAVIDADDVYTYGHSAQVAVYAGAIAEKLGLPREEQAVIVKAALVHDIGKVGVMDSIMGKQGPLTDEEYGVLKRHSIISAEIVGRMKGLHELVPLVRHHHERWDGKGYPDGLAGAEIPLGARILALADSVDAICSDRPYRPTRSFREVMAEVPRCSDKQFDPAVVKAFLAVVEEKGQSFFKNSAVTVDRAVLLAGMGTVNTASRYLKKSMITDRPA
jgi:putative nucleotidyltransferase with HDIG domain